MKILTLNTHSLAENNYEQKLHLFAQMIEQEQPDIFALQEVNQTMTEVPVSMDEAKNSLYYIPCQDFSGPVRQDNHALCLSSLLTDANCSYFWTWVPAKIGYGIYEEGLALFSRTPIQKTRQFLISQSSNFANWKTRKILGIYTQGSWYYSVHMGWWKDEEEPFALHWDRLTRHIRENTADTETVWICGDFNSPANISGEGYSYVKASGWHDTYYMAQEKDSGITVGGVIDGWRDQSSKTENEGMRIDYIWCSKNLPIRRFAVVFNGKNYPIVSDHYGVMIIL